MNEFYKIIIIVIATAILSIFLKQSKPEFSIILSIVVGILLLTFILHKVSDIFRFLDVILNKGNIDDTIFLVLIKVVAIGYLSDFTSNICIDTGNATLADKVDIVGKVMIFITSLPILETLFDIILELIV